MDAYIPDIQDRLRGNFPIVEAHEHQAVNAGVREVKIDVVKEWLFKSSDQRSAVIVGQSRLVYMTAEYDRFPGFQAPCEDALGVLIDVVKPALLFRVGLRYSDYIAPDKEPLSATVLEQCVHQHFLLHEDFREFGSINGNATHVSLASDVGTLQIASQVGAGLPVVQPDLASKLPVVLDVEPRNDQVALVLDIDHFWVAQTRDFKFTLERATDTLGKLHEGSRSAFWMATTDYARNTIWQ